MPSRGIPAASKRASSGGSTSRLGAGRVMSQTEMAAERLPRAISISSGQPMGVSSASLDGRRRVIQRHRRPRFQHAVIKTLR
jgi:hypothetical protein